MNRILLILTFSIPLAVYAQRPGQQADVKIQKTSLSRDQEIQLGKEAAAQVERENEVIHNAEIERWLNQIGQNLARTPQANAYPYYFKLINDESINAFALPGGPMYVHVGLLRAADNEGEVVGVLAHEMSHVALRHGAAQITKQQRVGTFFEVLGTAGGAVTGGLIGECGMLCKITEKGASLGENSLLMKFSRGYEHDADLNGARMMAAAGYNPIELPRFFEKLEATKGTAHEPKGLSLWMASHPATGSRIQYVSDDIRFYPQRDYTADTGSFPRVKQLVATIPPPRPQPGKLIQPKRGAIARSNLPAGLRDYPANGFAIGYPSAWQVGQAQTGGSIYMVPQGGAVKKQKGGAELLLGAMIDYYVPEGGAAGVSLDVSTKELVESLKEGDANLREEKSRQVEVGGKPALMTTLRTKTSLSQEPDQVIYLYTVAQEAGLWYVVLAVQPSRLDLFDPLFQEMIATVRFPN